jgi:L-lactate dehydrogenase (cytochrome)
VSKIVFLAEKRALLLTCDSNVGDHRQSAEKIKGTRGDAEPGIKSGPFTDFPPYHDAKQNWGDLDRLKELANGLPIYLKGVCHIDVSLANIRLMTGCKIS